MAVIDMTNANEQNLSTMIKVLSNMLNAKSELHKQHILIEAQNIMKAFPVCTTFDYMHVYYMQFLRCLCRCFVSYVKLLNNVYVTGNREFICFFQFWRKVFYIEKYTYISITM